MTVTFNDKTVSFASTGVQGLSAYQVALKNGFVGTENEWLLSIVHDNDMIKSVYDTNDDGVVNSADYAANADKLDNMEPSELPISVAVQTELNKINNGDW